MTEAERLELEFLRFFYEQAGEAFGPADSEVYDSIKEQWVDEGNQVPEGY